MPYRRAPEWQISHWFNTPEPLTLARLQGRPVLALAFQMLCPGCVSHGWPQFLRVTAAFPELYAIGLHSVFEHHDVQGTPAALAVFLHEYGIDVPVGLDMPGGGAGPPLTMRAYDMKGTPTLLLIDAMGRLRRQYFGPVSDLHLGAAVAALIGEAAAGNDNPPADEFGDVGRR
ncbi:hypothetical protein IP88_07580 [alpha proteobacterium AAP81b]|nr:hypothetical protein IP88_07580 [alpha proteobacterium AAP81b]